MAKQSGVVKIRGAVDDLTFLETKDGFKVRKKGRVATKETIATDPRYARMRENMSEFSRAVEGSKLLRLAVKDALLDIAEKRLATRLNKALMTVLMSGINMYSMALVMKVVLGWDINFSIWVASAMVAGIQYPNRIPMSRTSKARQTKPKPTAIQSSLIIGEFTTTSATSAANTIPSGTTNPNCRVQTSSDSCR